MAIQESISLDIQSFLQNLGKIQNEIERFAQDLGKDFKFSAEVDADTKSAESSIEKSNKKIRKDVSNSAKKIEKEYSGMFGRLKKGFSGFASSLSLGAGIGVGITAVQKLGQAASEAFNEFRELDKEVRNIGTLGVENFEEFTALSTKLAKEVPEQASGIAAAAYQAVSAGISGSNQEIIGFVEQAAKVGVAGLATTESAVNGLTTVLNAYKLETSDTQKISDTFFAAIKLGKTSFNEINGALANVVPTASAAGVGFDEISAAIAQFTALGTPTAQASTQLRAVMLELQKPTGDLEKFLDGLGLSTKDVQESLRNDGLIATLQNLQGEAAASGKDLNLLFGSAEAGAAVLNLTGNNAESAVKRLADVRSEIEGGASTKAYETAAQSLDVQLKLIGNNIQAAFNGVFEAIQPIAEKVLPILVSEFNNFYNAIRDVLSGVSSEFGDFAKLINGIVFGTLIVAFEIIRNTVITVFDIVVEVLNGIGNAFSPLTELFDNAGDSATSAADIFQMFRDVLGGLFSIVGDVVGVLSDLVFGILEVGIQIVVDIVSGFISLFQSTDKTAESAKGATSAFDVMMNTIKGIKNVLNGVRAAFGTVIDTVKEFIGSLTSFNLSDALKAFTGFGEKVSQSFEEGFNKISFEAAQEKYVDFINKINSGTSVKGLEEIIGEIGKVEEITDEQRLALFNLASTQVATLKAIAEEAKEIPTPDDPLKESAKTVKTSGKSIKDEFASVKKFLLDETKERTKKELEFEKDKNTAIVGDTANLAKSIKDELSKIQFNAETNDILGLENAVKNSTEQLDLINILKNDLLNVLNDKADQEIEILKSQAEQEKQILNERYAEQIKAAKNNKDLITQLESEKANQIELIDTEFKAKEVERRNEFDAEKFAADQTINNQILGIKEATANAENEIIKLQIEAERQKLSQYQSIFGQAASLFKENTLAYKLAASAEAGISTYLAANKALTLPFPLNWIQFALTLGAGLKNVAKINNIGFMAGGYTGDGGTSDVAGVVHGKEFVSTAAVTKRERPLLEYLHKGGSSADYFNIMAAGKYKANLNPDNSSNELVKEVRALNKKLGNQRILSTINVQVDNNSKHRIKIKKGAINRL